ncbi:MAG: tetratricopeptide repeat protein [Archangium sp.]|nr:tetratricopeptide repeat protein [Archangium sp.]MDP3156224.1 tetratricopeptide repeat protein [Archangium sp.]MDP3571561.1 tetratricopeptide repeat protein [Archangium sp.]
MRLSWMLLVAMVVTGCVHTRGEKALPKGAHEVKFDEVVITGDLELEKLNDEELFAAGTSFYAAEDYAQAARYFGRICDFHPKSKHYRPALYNAGLALEKIKAWEDAWVRFSVLSDPVKGTGDALDASFRVAECDYHLERYTDAIEVLRNIADRSEVSADKRIEARVQQGICELEIDQKDAAENTLRSVLTYWNSLPDKDLVDDYFPGQAQFFIGEIFRLHYEAVALDGNKSTAKLAEDLEYKSELLLSSQGHYLRAIRIGNGYWATAAGNRIGGLYENMYDHMIHAPAPIELAASEQEIYRAELRKKIRVLIGKAITVYERTLEAAERIGASSPFVQQTRESLQRMKDLLLAEAKAEEEEKATTTPPGS